jgi:hypothetical protein
MSMKRARAATAALALGWFVVNSAAAVPTPHATLISAPIVTLPGDVDSNSPVMWDLDDGQRKMFVLTSHSGVPSLSSGSEVDRLAETTEVSLLPHPGYGVWFEAVVSDDVDTWYGYYHNEWPATRCDREDRAVARIGAAKSTDNGRTWTDLGPVIQAYQSATACESTNRYVIGGDGDFQRDARFVENVSLLLLQPVPPRSDGAGCRDRADVVGRSRSAGRPGRLVARRHLGA